MAEQLLVVGDVHGCYQTFRTLIAQHWRPQDEVMVQVGDLIDRGNYSPECVATARSLNERFPNKAIFLKGNHEFECVLYHEKRSNPGWLNQGGRETLQQYKITGRSMEGDIPWFKNLPLFYENEHVMISHAGVTSTPNPFSELNSYGVLWNRVPLKNIGKIQVIGHTPVDGEPDFRDAENAWNIDTGAYRGNALSALRIDASGRVKEIISVPTVDSDYIGSRE
ncbi:MAG: metallophosphoesterase family protein [Candidatus Kapaibacterium sp.]|jgi:serine/threonine protein phosphatase 1